jgi:dTDP-4-dehydrorhamnose 3,5-epimerase
MIFHETEIAGAYLIDIEKHEDDRGFFGRAYCRNEFNEKAIPFPVAQANIAHSLKKGTLRGMHYQLSPHEESKLVRCVRGAIYDVIIDLRKNSTSYGKWLGVELRAESYRSFHIPAGTAHGYLTLTNDTEMFYMVSEFYAQGAERGIRWNDPSFGIDWPHLDRLIISEKDKSWPDFVLEK